MDALLSLLNSKAVVSPGCVLEANFDFIEFATVSPSTAAETMPPAKPAPSPQGNRLSTPMACKVLASLFTRTGDDVLVYEKHEMMIDEMSNYIKESWQTGCTYFNTMQ